MSDREHYRIEVQALPDSVPAIHRLRAWLKQGLRQHRLRCTHAIEVPAGEAQSAAAAPPASASIVDAATGGGDSGGGGRRP